MPKLQKVHCRICKGAIDREVEIKGVDWINPAKNQFYHKKCYEDWACDVRQITTEASEDLWWRATADFLEKDLKISINYAKMRQQWDYLLKSKKTAKGIYFTLRYFYDVAHGDPSKSEGGIGIVKSVYSEGCTYWVEREKRDKDICAKITAQVIQRQKQEKIRVAAKPHERKKTVDLAAVEMED